MSTIHRKTLITTLSDALQQQNSAASPLQVERLISYLYLLQKWNKVYNLTGIDDIETMIPYHILDSLSVMVFLTGNTFLDVGTGAGLPSIPLAIMQPHKQFYLLDSSEKKIHFLKQVKLSLQLDNIVICQCRIEKYQPDIIWDGIISRAFASLDKFIKATQHLMVPTTRLIAMKGPKAAAEIATLDQMDYHIETHHVTVPLLRAGRYVVIVSKPGVIR